MIHRLQRQSHVRLGDSWCTCSGRQKSGNVMHMAPGPTRLASKSVDSPLKAFQIFMISRILKINLIGLLKWTEFMFMSCFIGCIMIIINWATPASGTVRSFVVSGYMVDLLHEY